MYNLRFLRVMRMTIEPVFNLKDAGYEEILTDLFPQVDTASIEGSYVSLDSVISKAYTLYIEEGNVNDKIFQLIIDTLTYMSFEDVTTQEKRLDVSQVLEFFESLFYMLRDGDFTYLTKPRGLKFDKVVDIEEFVKSSQYMNQRRHVRPPIMKCLIEAFHGEGSEGYVECIAGGAIGIGKNYYTDLGLAYVIYRLSCYHNPQLEYGLAPGSSMVFIMQSKTLQLAKKVAFKQFGARLRESPYFQKYFQFDTKTVSELRFPNDVSVLPISSSDTAALGMNTFGGMIDEMNFLSNIEKSSRAGGDSYDQAEQLYNTIMRRMKSRYNVMGKIPGRLFLISSANYPDGFIERKCREREEQLLTTGKSSIHVMRMAHWESYPPERLSTEKFLLEIGDDARPSRILETREDALDESSILEIPIDYKPEFVRDIEAALRDIAGIPIGGSNIYIKQRDKIAAAVEGHKATYNGHQLFTTPTVDIRQFENNLEALIDDEYLDKLLEAEITPLFVHLDNAVSEEGDHAGIGVSFLSGYKWVGRTTNYDPWLKYYTKCEPTEYPFIVCAGAIEIVPPIGDEIDLDTISRFLQLLCSRLRVKAVTGDQFQSAQILQQLRKVKNIVGESVKTGIISVDKDIAAYAEFKQAIRDERILLPNHEKMLSELRKLEFDIKKFKVDHGDGGSKDIIDAVCGSAYVAAMGERKQMFKRIGERRRLTKREQTRELRGQGMARRLH